MKPKPMRNIEDMAEMWENAREKLDIPAESLQPLKMLFYAGALSALKQVMRDVRNGKEGLAAIEGAVDDMIKATGAIEKSLAPRKKKKRP